MSEPHRYKNLRVDEVSFVDRAASPGARITFWKRHPDAEKSMSVKKNDPNLDAVLAKLSDEDKKVMLGALEAAGKPPAPDAKPDAPPAAKPDAPPAPPADDKKETTAKRDDLPEDVRKKLDEFEEIKKAHAQDRERILKMEEDNLTRVYVEKAAKLSNVPGLSRNDLGEVLKAADLNRPMSKELGVKLAKALKSIDEVVAKSALFGEVGSIREGSGADSAQGKLESIAKAYREKDPSLTEAKAYAKALKEHPQLYAEYENENPVPVITGR